MKKSNIENRVTMVTILTVILVILTIVWIICALKVDFNGLAYNAQISHYIDMGKSIGTAADYLHASRLAMQNSGFWALRLAARLPFWGRMLITAGFILLIYKVFGHLVDLLLVAQQEQQRRRQHRRCHR